MKPIKGFDCVQMKWDIQQKLLEEERLLGPEGLTASGPSGYVTTPSWVYSSGAWRRRSSAEPPNGWNRSPVRVEPSG